MTRLNIGCGQTPTAGWINYDNSPSVRLAGMPALAGALGRLKLLSASQREFIDVARGAGIRHADAVAGIPHRDRSVDVIYSSHMIEHLDRGEARRFLAEARRVLVGGGVIRIAAPDLRFHVDRYLAQHDADRFVEGIRLGRSRVRGLRHTLMSVLVRDREHHWMYDGASLVRLLADAGFLEPRVMPAGTTTIPDPGALDLSERIPESVFVEAANP